MCRGFSRHTVVIAFLSAWFVEPAALHASNVPAGTDFFESIPSDGAGGGTWFSFGGLPVGVVELEGLAIGPGTTDTKVERLQDAKFPSEGTNLWPGAPTAGTAVTIDIELVALSLKSIGPVDVGGTDFDVFMTLDLVTPSIGTMTISHEWADNGNIDPEGTFDSVLNVFVDANFVPLGGGPGAFQVDIDNLSLSSSSTLWSHEGSTFGNLFVENIIEQHPAAGTHKAKDAVPEPATLSLLALGGLMLARRRGHTCIGAMGPAAAD